MLFKYYRTRFFDIDSYFHPMKFSLNSLIIGVGLLFLLILSSCQNDDDLTVGETVISAVEIQMNPSGLAPLTAMLRFNTLRSARVSITIPGKNPLIKEFSDLNQVHEIPILGLYANTTNYVIVTASDDSGNSSTEVVPIETGDLPEYLPEIEIVQKSEAQMEEGWNLLTYNQGLGAPNFITVPTMFDQDGDIRWYLDFSSIAQNFSAGPVEPLQNGNLLFAQNNTIFEYDMMGFEKNTWVMPENYFYHHDVIEKPNGNFIVAVDDSNLGTIEDIAIEIDRNSSSVLNRWDLREILDVDRFELINDPVDWFHMNALWYDEADDAVIFSGQRQGLVKVSNQNELIWILAPHRNWGQAGINGDGHETSNFLLTAVDQSNQPYDAQVQEGVVAMDDFEWTWGQHAPMYLDNGNLWVYDNGFRRSWGAPRGTYSRGVEYQIDETAMTVRQVWQVGKEKGASFQSHIISDVDVLPNTGNRIVFSGINLDERKSHLIEVNPTTSETIFEAIISYKFAFVPDGAPLAPGNLDSSYRMERMSVYSGIN